MNQRAYKHASKHLEKWRARIALWQASGLTQAAFCRKHGLTESRFRWWKQRIKEPQRTPPQSVGRMKAKPESAINLVEVPGVMVMGDGRPAFRLMCQSDYSIEVPAYFDPP